MINDVLAAARRSNDGLVPGLRGELTMADREWHDPTNNQQTNAKDAHLPHDI